MHVFCQMQWSNRLENGLYTGVANLEISEGGIFWKMPLQKIGSSTFSVIKALIKAKSS